jgi:hypothetical protein
MFQLRKKVRRGERCHQYHVPLDLVSFSWRDRLSEQIVNQLDITAVLNCQQEWIVADEFDAAS